jgi:hypothetical protein
MALGRPQVRLDVGGGAHVYYKRTSAVPSGVDVSAFSELIENATVTVGVGNQVGRQTATDPAPSFCTRAPQSAPHAQPWRRR